MELIEGRMITMVANRRWRHSEWWMHKNVSAREMPLHVGGDEASCSRAGTPEGAPNPAYVEQLHTVKKTRP